MISQKIFKQEAKFIAGAAKVSQLPKVFLPQIAFIGKSNVGKSSLINKICNRRNLARTSNTPGRTQQINFFSLDDKFLLVDLPGYGFAKVPPSVKEEWEKLFIHYIQNSPQLQLVNLLIDARRGLKENDLFIINFLQENNKKFQLIFTKTDCIKSHDSFIAETKQIMKLNNASDCEIILTSSKSGLGIKELQLSIISKI